MLNIDFSYFKRFFNLKSNLTSHLNPKGKCVISPDKIRTAKRHISTTKKEIFCIQIKTLIELKYRNARLACTRLKYDILISISFQIDDFDSTWFRKRMFGGGVFKKV